MGEAGGKFAWRLWHKMSFAWTPIGNRCVERVTRRWRCAVDGGRHPAPKRLHIIYQSTRPLLETVSHSLLHGFLLVDVSQCRGRQAGCALCRSPPPDPAATHVTSVIDVLLLIDSGNSGGSGYTHGAWQGGRRRRRLPVRTTAWPRCVVPPAAAAAAATTAPHLSYMQGWQQQQQ